MRQRLGINGLGELYSRTATIAPGDPALDGQAIAAKDNGRFLRRDAIANDKGAVCGEVADANPDGRTCRAFHHRHQDDV